jgi:competence protein ComER
MVISITSPIGPELLDRILPGHKTARIIPSITNAVLQGVTLLTFGSRLSLDDKKYLTNLMSSISTPIEIDESITRVSSDMVSCGPAFFSFLMQRFIDSAIMETPISEEDATKMMTSMIIGLGRLLEEGGYTLSELQAKVCVPGGITGIGLNVIDKETDTLFLNTLRATMKKFQEDIEEIEESFQNQKNPYH